MTDQKKPKVDYQALATKRLIEGNIVGIRSLLEGDIPELEFLVHGCVPVGSIVLMCGESNSGKSFLAYDLALAIAGGTTWLGHGLTDDTPKTVLILNYDNPTDTLKFRVNRMGFTADQKVFAHTQWPTGKMLRLPQEGVALKTIIDELQPSLTIVDSLRQAHNFDENDNQEMAKLMEIFKSWTTVDSKNTVILLHHTAKKSNSSWSSSARGSGEIVASSDVVIEVHDRTMKWTKCRAWDVGEDIETTFEIKDKHIVLPNNTVRTSTNVRATSDLPGEKAYIADRKILTFLRDKTRVSRNDIYTATKPMQKSIVDASIRRLEATNKIQYRHTNKGRFYQLFSSEEPMDEVDVSSSGPAPDTGEGGAQP